MALTPVVLVVRYAGFAVLATVVNLASQRGVLSFAGGELGLALAIAIGTICGLLVKYYLDKRWIFADSSTGLREHGRRFSLYTLMGILTTLIFWGSEVSFWLIWKSDVMRELGAALGLTVGYVLKYRLDKRFVFGPSRQPELVS